MRFNFLSIYQIILKFVFIYVAWLSLWLLGLSYDSVNPYVFLYGYSALLGILLFFSYYILKGLSLVLFFSYRCLKALYYKILVKLDQFIKGIYFILVKHSDKLPFLYVTLISIRFLLFFNWSLFSILNLFFTIAVLIWAQNQILSIKLKLVVGLALLCLWVPTNMVFAMNMIPPIDAAEQVGPGVITKADLLALLQAKSPVPDFTVGIPRTNRCSLIDGLFDIRLNLLEVNNRVVRLGDDSCYLFPKGSGYEGIHSFLGDRQLKAFYNAVLCHVDQLIDKRGSSLALLQDKGLLLGFSKASNGIWSYPSDHVLDKIIVALTEVHYDLILNKTTRYIETTSQFNSNLATALNGGLLAAERQHIGLNSVMADFTYSKECFDQLRNNIVLHHESIVRISERTQLPLVREHVTLSFLEPMANIIARHPELVDSIKPLSLCNEIHLFDMRLNAQAIKFCFLLWDVSCYLANQQTYGKCGNSVNVDVLAAGDIFSHLLVDTSFLASSHAVRGIIRGWHLRTLSIREDRLAATFIPYLAQEEPDLVKDAIATYYIGTHCFIASGSELKESIVLACL